MRYLKGKFSVQDGKCRIKDSEREFAERMNKSALIKEINNANKEHYGMADDIEAAVAKSLGKACPKTAQDINLIHDIYWRNKKKNDAARAWATGE